jgi:hypothetical protein
MTKCRTEKNVDRLALAEAATLSHDQMSLLDGQNGTAVQDEGAIAPELDLIGDHRYRHGRQMADYLVKQALPFRPQMRDNHDGEARLRRQSTKKALKGLDTAGRGANPDNGKLRFFHGNRYLQPVLHRLQCGQLRTAILRMIPSAVNGLTADARVSLIGPSRHVALPHELAR